VSAEFKLERYLVRYEFSAGHLHCASEVEGYRLPDLPALANRESRELWDDFTLGSTESRSFLRALVGRD
jgi:hypothetical protein